MVYTVTLNPAIDYIVSPAKFSAGEINRYQKAVYGPGGKGANVSLLLSSLGVRNRALGICAGLSGGEIVRLLEERGCETDFVRMPQGHSRINVKVCAPDGEETDLNGDGPDTPPEAVEELLQKLDGLGEGDTLVLAGSIPRSVPGDIYAAMLRRLEGRGVLAVVDATGEALRCVLQAVSGKAQQRRAGGAVRRGDSGCGYREGICQAAGAGRREKRGGLHGGQGRAAGG